MRFLYPQILLLLVLILLLTLYTIYQIYSLRKEIKKFGDTELVQALMPDLSLKRRLYKDLLLLLSSALLVIAAARPQMGTKEEKVKKRGIEIMVCLDLSNSMLAKDVSPSRLSVAKNIVSRLTDKLQNNKVGLIYFTSSAYVQLPMTADMVSAKLFLSQAEPSIMPDQGTDISAALQLAGRSFTSTEDKKVGRAVILITDSEDHSTKSIDAAKDLLKKGIITNVIGVGSEKGSPIETQDGYIKDENGEIVISKLNDDAGRKLAAAGKGIFIRATNVNGASTAMVKELDSLEKADFKSTIYAAYDEKYAWFLIPAILLLIFDCIYLNRKNRYFRQIKFFEDKEI